LAHRFFREDIKLFQEVVDVESGKLSMREGDVIGEAQKAGILYRLILYWKRLNIALINDKPYNSSKSLRR